MRYLSAPQRRRRQRFLIGVLLFAVLTAALVALLVAQWWLEKTRTLLDADTLCPVEGEPSAYVAVLVDTTDPLSILQRRFVEDYLDRLHITIPRLGRLTLYAVREVSEETVNPVFSRCNPGDGRDVSFVTGNPREAKRRWEKGFASPVHSVLDELMHSEPAPSSPIMEMIQAVSVTGLPFATERPKRLIIVSDMLQNTPDYTHYGPTPPSFSRFANGSLLDRYLAPLDGTSVTILYLRRHEPAAGRVQGRAHISFWEAFSTLVGPPLMR